MKYGKHPACFSAGRETDIREICICARARVGAIEVGTCVYTHVYYATRASLNQKCRLQLVLFWLRAYVCSKKVSGVEYSPKTPLRN